MSLARVRLDPKVLPKLMGFPKGVSLREVVVDKDGMLELLLTGDVPEAHGAFVSMKGSRGLDGSVKVEFGAVYAPAPEGGDNGRP